MEDSSVWIQLIQSFEKANVTTQIFFMIGVFFIVSMMTGNGGKIYKLISSAFMAPVHIYNDLVGAVKDRPVINYKSIDIPSQQKIHIYRLPEIFYVSSHDFKDLVDATKERIASMKKEVKIPHVIVIDASDTKEMNIIAEQFVVHLADLFYGSTVVKLVIVFNEKLSDDMRKFKYDIEVEREAALATGKSVSFTIIQSSNFTGMVW